MQHTSRSRALVSTVGVALVLALCLAVAQALLPAPVMGAVSVVSLTPASGPVRTTVALTGTIDTNNGVFEVHWDSTTGALLATAAASGTSVSSAFPIPEAPAGNHNVYLKDVTAGTYSGALVFLVTSQLAVTPASAVVGSTITVSGTGFGTSETAIVVTYDGAAVSSGIAAGGTGSWSASFIVPDCASGVNHILDAYGALTAAASVPDLSFTVTPLISATPRTGVAGTTVTVTANGFTVSESGLAVTYDGVAVASGLTASATGIWSATFLVPECASLVNHLIDAYGAITTAATVPDLSFTVSPVISITPATGPVGTTVTVTARGFATGETGIAVTYDGLAVTTSIVASSLGSWSGSFAVPLSALGAHVVDASGASTSAANVPDVSFGIMPAITVSPLSGPTGTTVSVTATGFAANEAGVVINLGAAVVKDGLSADANGRWTATFTVPAGPGGKQMVGARGGSTAAGMVSGVAFSVTARIAASPTSGTVGTPVAMSGASFGAGETGISVTYDGVAIASGLSANANGDWSTTFPLPASPMGNHAVGASGSATPGASVATVSITVSPAMAVTPASGFVGTPVTVSGTGFVANTGLTVTYEGASANITPRPLVTDGKGSFTASLVAPRSKGGPHKVTVFGGNVTREAAWAMDSTPPPLPKPVGPEAGQRLSIFGNVPVTFAWTPVTDPSGVYYSLQVDTTPDFTGTPQKKDELVSSNYTTSATEMLPLGTYYWRVKAMDGAYNESAWTTASLFRIGWLPLWMAVAIGVIVVALLALLAMWLRSRAY